MQKAAKLPSECTYAQRHSQCKEISVSNSSPKLSGGAYGPPPIPGISNRYARKLASDYSTGCTHGGMTTPFEVIEETLTTLRARGSADPQVRKKIEATG